jgi:hypothetical protein
LRIVLDACVPEPLRLEISGHEVVTARYLGLSRLEDSQVVSAIEADWDVLITCDRNLPWQNKFAGRDIAVIVLRARTNKLQDLVPLVPTLQATLTDISSGEVREIG